MSEPPCSDARAVVAALTDPGSFVSWDPADPPPLPRPPAQEYAAELRAARERTGSIESVVTGQADLDGRRIAVVAGEFGFLGGSIGVATAELFVRAVERATTLRLPLLAAPASAGTRMQEGTLAFVQMVKVAAAIAAHKAAGLPYLVYLRDPTFGGVTASWASLGHVTVAEPGAHIGFLGPKVYEVLTGQPFPAGVQRAENLHRRGIIDAIAPPGEAAEVFARALRVMCASTSPAGPETGPRPGPTSRDGGGEWASILATRDPRRPGVRELLRYGARDVLRLSGTGQGEREPSVLLALCRFGDVGCVVLGQDRAAHAISGPIGPAGLRGARRGMALARDLHLPLVSVVDTAGAELSRAAEEGGLAGEIARCLVELVTLETATVSVILGEGSGGGALALLPADRILATEHGWLAPLPPEGASAIVHGHADAAAGLAAAQRVYADDLLADGLVDRVVPEAVTATEQPERFCTDLGGILAQELAALVTRPVPELLAERLARARGLGEPPGERDTA